MQEMLGLKKGIVKLVTHEDIWANSYNNEKSIILNAMGRDAIAIEHIGSTSIPGIKAKPIIDISVGISYLEDIRKVEKIAKLLEATGYEWRRQSSNPDNYVFVKGPEEKRTIYLHLVEYEGVVWKNDLRFRDALTQNPELREEYQIIKEKLAKEFPNDRESYTKGKVNFFERVLSLA